MNKKQFINAYTFLFGTTKKQAENAYKTSSSEYKKAIIKTFGDNAKRVFITD